MLLSSLQPDTEPNQGLLVWVSIPQRPRGDQWLWRKVYGAVRLEWLGADLGRGHLNDFFPVERAMGKVAHVMESNGLSVVTIAYGC